MGVVPFLNVLRNNSKFIVLVFFLSIGIYANSLGNSFAVVDDLQGYIESQTIRSIPESLKTLHIQQIIYSMNYHFFGMNPLPLRILTLIDHGIASVLIFIILFSLFGKKPAYIGSILFAVHPINSEAVNWVSAHFYILMANFQFAAILAHLAYRKTNNVKFLYITVGIFILYLLTFRHPWVLTLPFVITFIDFFLLGKGFDFKFQKSFWLLVSPILLLYLLFTFPRIYNQRMEGQTAQNGRVLMNEQAIIPILESYPYTVYNMFKLYLYPKDLTIYYDGREISTAERLLMFTTFLGYIGALIYTYYQDKKLTGLLLLLIICIAPVFSPIKVTWYIAERYLYFGTGFFTALIALLLIRAEKKWHIPHLAYIATLIIFVLFAARTWYRTMDWKNPETLAFATIQASPKSVRPYNDLAGHYVLNNRIDDAKRFYKKALSMYPSSVAMNNLGYLYILHDLDPSIRTLNQPYTDIMQLGNESMQKKNFRMALYYYNEIYTPDSKNVDLINNIAAALMELGSYNLSKKYLDRARAINPQSPDTYFFYGYLSFKQGDIENAIQHLEKVLELNPNHGPARSNLEYVKSQRKN